MDWTSPEVGWATPKVGWASPKVGWASPRVGWASPRVGWASQRVCWASPQVGWASSEVGWAAVRWRASCGSLAAGSGSGDLLLLVASVFSSGRAPRLVSVLAGFVVVSWACYSVVAACGGSLAGVFLSISRYVTTSYQVSLSPLTARVESGPVYVDGCRHYFPEVSVFRAIQHLRAPAGYT